MDVDALAQALQQADRCVVLDSDDIQWPLEQLCERLPGRCSVAGLRSLLGMQRSNA